MQQNRMHFNRTGISRAELITTVLVVVIMTGLLIPWVFQQRGVSQRNFCELRQIVAAKGLFMSAVESPTYPGFREIQARLPDQSVIESSWVYPILPYIHPLGSEIGEELKNKSIKELSKLDDAERLRDGPYRRAFEDFGELGKRAGKQVPDYLVELVCPESGKSPTASRPQPMSFVVNTGMPDIQSGDGPLDHLANGVFFDRVGGADLMTVDYLLEHDGLETTVMLSENLDAGQTFDTREEQIGFVWINSYVDDLPGLDTTRLLGINQNMEGANGYQLARPSSFHPGGVNVAFADGSTMFMSDKIDYLAYVHYMTANGYDVKIAGSQDSAKDPYRLTK